MKHTLRIVFETNIFDKKYDILLTTIWRMVLGQVKFNQAYSTNLHSSSLLVLFTNNVQYLHERSQRVFIRDLAKYANWFK